MADLGKVPDSPTDRKWPGWVARFGPPATILLIGAVGWASLATVGRAKIADLTNSLETTLSANITAMTLWLEAQKASVGVAAADPRVRATVGEMSGLRGTAGEDVPTDNLIGHPAAKRLREILTPIIRETGHIRYDVVDRTGRVIASSTDDGVGTRRLAELAESVRASLSGTPSVSRPFLSEVPVPQLDGPPRVDVPTMAVAAPIRSDGGDLIAALVLRVDPDAGFTRILQVARFGESGETYAVDSQGLLLSQSRFDDQLRKLGLLDWNGRSMLGVQVRDPGGDLTEGFRPVTPRAEQPLTRMAAALAAGRKGSDIDGYRDYRGVPVVGAWQWLPDYKMGVATEVDVAEAYQSLWILRRTIWALLILLAVSYVGNLLAVRAVTALRRKAQLDEEKARQAELQARQLGQYTLEEKIGEGGIGAVYRASHAMLRRPTAVKLLSTVRPDMRELLRFEREVQLTSQLNHPNTITIFDFGRTPEGIFYYAMEYLPGINLQRLVDNFGKLPDGRVLYILTQVAAALQEAHAVGLVHRDIKPANLMLCERGGVYDFVKVLDFGLVRDARGTDPALTAVGMIAGTPQYLAPEAIRDPNSADARTDLYAVGAVGYFLLTGRPLFAGPSSADILAQHLSQIPEPPSKFNPLVSADLEALILRCVAKTPGNRPADATELLNGLMKCNAYGTWTNDQARQWWVNNDPTRSATGASADSRKMADSPAITMQIAFDERGV